ncbi:hypothetical protein [Soonwooa sp.]|uniref:hypothetical protein n=1 Tax=Soonwooa sp. TaxID=1938592 RepID=UPI0035AF72EC
MRKILAAHALILLFIGCSSDSERGGSHENESAVMEITPKDQAINSNGYLKYIIKKGSSTINPNQFRWSTSTKAATIDEFGNLNPKIIGEVKVSAENYNTKEVLTTNLKINPIENFFKEPILTFGKNREEIKKAETRTLISEVKDFHGHYILTFKGENPDVEKITYAFRSVIQNSNELGLFDCSVYFRKDKALEDKISQFYRERYLKNSGMITDWWGYSLDYKIEVSVKLNSVASPNTYAAGYGLAGF